MAVAEANSSFSKQDNDTKFSRDSMEIFKIASTATFLFFIFVASVAGNLLVFLVFYKRPALLTISNRFILNLSICSSLNTIFVMPFMFGALIAEDWIFGTIWCKVTGFLMNAIFAASTLTLVAISLDRYCAVVTPLHYQMRITKRRSALIIAAVWILAVLVSLPPLFGWNHYRYQKDKGTCTVLWSSRIKDERYYTFSLVILTFILPLCIILWAYHVIFKAAQNNSERTRRNSVIPNNQVDEPCSTQTPLRCERRRSSTAPILHRRLSTSGGRIGGSLLWHRDEWKTALASLLVVSTFIVCWLPYFIIIILEASVHNSQDIPPVIETISILLAMMSFACNPLVYVFRSKLARQEVKIIMKIQSRESINMSLSRRGSESVFTREGIVHQSSIESDIVPFEKPLHSSSTSTTLTSLVHNPNAVSQRS
ncbi:G-protein coupled receptor 161-like [Saccostrea echinata]|uniref:G-protein coupled receptor 161-like n=1 Tax=Saccostrea echinata TaxID=191078 RepID=UPI002A81AECA|nr:G-protein coupled receptor 161-like [Saccostrea echinata]